VLRLVSWQVLTCCPKRRMVAWKGSDLRQRGDSFRWRERRGRPELRARFWIEVLAAVLCGLLAILTLIVEDWIEVLFGVDPDAHSGAAEWLVVALLGAGVVISALLAGHEWQRTSTLANEEA
jgi:hypothetical protein